jgi:hypothetical protein
MIDDTYFSFYELTALYHDEEFFEFRISPLDSGSFGVGVRAQSAKTQLYVATEVSASDVKSASRSEQLLAKAEEFTKTGNGFYCPPDASLLSEEFVFRGPVVGPLNKKDYLHTLGECFQIYKAFPDISANAWGFSIDPENPNKVWFMVRMTGTMENDWQLAANLPAIPANGKLVKGPPETHSILYDDEMKVKCLTVGYVADRNEGNTNGSCAAFGLMEGIGYKLPPLQIYRIASELTNGFMGGPIAFSTDLPKWWPHEGRLNDGM